MRFPAFRLAILRGIRAGALAAIPFALAAPASAEESPDVALVTAVQGGVARATPQGTQAVPAFVKLKRGDRLTLAGGSIQLVYFESGRQENWRGDGKLEVGSGASKATGLPEPDTRTLPDIMVRQIAKTPALDSQGRAGVVRLRGLPSPATVERIVATYRQLRDWAGANDLSPELYLLSGLFEQHDLDRIQQVLADLARASPSDAQVDQLVAFYRQLVEAEAAAH